MATARQLGRVDVVRFYAAYFSSDFGDHTTGANVAGIFQVLLFIIVIIIYYFVLFSFPGLYLLKGFYTVTL